MPRIAVLDLGTNTFHLLIVDVNDKRFEKVYQERIFTKLGAEGVEKIGLKSYRSGIEALTKFSQVINTYEVDHVKALGTSALRQASNGDNFIQEAKDRCGITIDVIDGQKEAEYIYNGVRLAIPQQSEPYIIMDIGGGSVEFIIADSHQSLYKQSFAIGLAPLHAIADISDIAEVDDMIELHRWLTSKLSSLYTAIAQYQPRKLIGSAGAFEVLLDMTTGSLENKTWASIDHQQLAELYVKVLRSSKKEKLQMPGLPRERVDYISAAFVLIWHIMDSTQPEEILVSKYALKEGVLATFLE